MNINDLKLNAAGFVVDSKMSKPAKLQMLKFIQHEATEEQLMVILLDGKIEVLDEQASEIVRDRFAVNEAMTQDTKDAITPYNRMFGVCAKKCGRIALSTKAAACKKACQNQRDQAIYKARLKIKAAKKAGGPNKKANVAAIKAKRAKELEASKR